MEHLRSADVNPKDYVERLIARANLAHESDEQHEVRWAKLRAEEADGQGAYDRIIDEIADWNEGLRTFR